MVRVTLAPLLPPRRGSVEARRRDGRVAISGLKNSPDVSPGKTGAQFNRRTSMHRQITGNGSAPTQPVAPTTVPSVPDAKTTFRLVSNLIVDLVLPVGTLAFLPFIHVAARRLRRCLHQRANAFATLRRYFGITLHFRLRAHAMRAVYPHRDAKIDIRQSANAAP